jgi:putative transcriptional regulator
MHGLTVKISHCGAALLLAASAAAGQQRIADVAAGKFLVASRHLPDPNFSETVVLVLHHGKGGTVGLIINRPTEKPLSAVLDLKQAAGRNDPVYAGGPVARTGIRALMRSKVKPDETPPVLGDVYVVTNRSALESALTGPAQIRVYFGYCGWVAGQLDREIMAGAWHVMAGEAATVFDADPQSVWPRLIRRTELRLALAAYDISSADGP